MEKRIISVLRSGGDFQPRHAQALQRQIARWAPGARFTLLSDVDVPGVECIPLKYNWPHWWAKLEMFRPEIGGDFLYTDLDNVLLGPLDDILSVEKYTTQGGQSNALTYYPADICANIWEHWSRDPEQRMAQFARGTKEDPNAYGDGGYIKSITPFQQSWEVLFPGQVTNIVEFAPAIRMASAPWHFNSWPMRLKDIPKTTRVFLCYRPWRPWVLPVFKLMGLYNDVT